MKVLIFMGLCIVLTGCNNDTYNRGYVISKSHLDTESKAVPAANSETEILDGESSD